MKKPITFERSAEAVRGLDDVEVGTDYGTPALKVRGRVFARIASHKER